MEEKKRGDLRPHGGPTGAPRRTSQLLPLILPIRDSLPVPRASTFPALHARRMAPTKRSWEEANTGSSDLDTAGSLQGGSGGTAAGRHARPLQNPAAAGDAPATSPTGATSAATSQHVPMISRKIRACASCRKHKVTSLPFDAFLV